MHLMNITVCLCASLLASGCGHWFDPADQKFESGGFESTKVVRIERPGAPALAEAGAGVLKQGDPLVIGFWNIQWLDSEKERNKPPQKPEDLADYIAASGVDVLGVAEIGAVVADGAWRSNTLELVVQRLTERGTGNKWRYMLFPNSDDDLRQLTGILWNGDRVQMLGWAPAPIDRRGADEIWHRHPVAVKFSAGNGLTDLIVIPIHMRCCLDVELRRMEAERLVAALPTLQGTLRDPDVIIIGDANLWNHDEPAGRVYRKSGLRDLNQRDRATHTEGIPFDRAFVTDTPEFRDVTMQVFDAEYTRVRGVSVGRFKERFSDHYLIRVPVTVRPDED